MSHKHDMNLQNLPEHHDGSSHSCIKMYPGRSGPRRLIVITITSIDQLRDNSGHGQHLAVREGGENKGKSKRQILKLDSIDNRKHVGKTRHENLIITITLSR